LPASISGHFDDLLSAAARRFNHQLAALIRAQKCTLNVRDAAHWLSSGLRLCGSCGLCRRLIASALVHFPQARKLFAAHHVQTLD